MSLIECIALVLVAVLGVFVDGVHGLVMGMMPEMEEERDE